jgi:rubredoxin
MAALSLVSVKAVAAAAAAGLHTQQQQQQQQHGVQSGRIFKSEGLSLPSDRMALKSAFHNGGGGGSSGLLIGSQGVDASIAAVRSRVTMRVATTKGAYICRDCGYIYTDRKPFESLPNDYSCPVCAAPKRRFKPYELPVAKNANDVRVRKARKEELKKSDSALGFVPFLHLPSLEFTRAVLCSIQDF